MALSDSDAMMSDSDVECVGSSLIPEPSGKPSGRPRPSQLAKIPKKPRFSEFNYDANKDGWVRASRDDETAARNRMVAMQARDNAKKKKPAAKRPRLEDSDDEDEAASSSSSESELVDVLDSDEEPKRPVVKTQDRLNREAAMARLAEKQREQRTEPRARPLPTRRALVEPVEKPKRVVVELEDSSEDEPEEDESTGEALLAACSKCTRELVSGAHDEASVAAKAIEELCGSDLTLKPHQIVGVNWLLLLEKLHLNGVLADAMGLGKTVQTIAYLAVSRSRAASHAVDLVVAPASTLDNWLCEFRKFAPGQRVKAYRGSAAERRSLRDTFSIANVDCIVTTYAWWERDASLEDRAFFLEMEYAHLVLDEGHVLKNPEAKRSKRLRELGERCASRLVLSGTPIQNDPLDVLSLLAFLMPKLFDANLRDTLKSLSLGGHASLVSRLRAALAPFVLRRLKKDVADALPPKTTEVVRVELSGEQRAAYDGVVAEHAANKSRPNQCIFSDLRKAANHPLLLHTAKPAVIEAMVKATFRAGRFGEGASRDMIRAELKSLSDIELHDICLDHPRLKKFTLKEDRLFSSAKFRALAKLLPGLAKDGHRILVFSQWVKILDLLGLLCKSLDLNACRLDGSTDVAERHQLVQTFNTTTTYDVFLLSTRAGGLGINLVAADVVVLHDVDFNPEIDRQAEDRAHRIGQTRPVSVYRLVAGGTVDALIDDVARKKQQVNDQVMDKGATTADKGDDDDDDRAVISAAIEDMLRDFRRTPRVSPVSSTTTETSPSVPGGEGEVVEVIEDDDDEPDASGIFDDDSE